MSNSWQVDFQALQRRLPAAWQSLGSDPRSERTVVVLPSISLPPLELERVKGSVHYEERLLSFLTLLGMPKTKVVYLSSLRIPDEVIAYYLQFLPGVTFSHARERLQLIALQDRSDRPLTEKVLERPAVVERIRRTIVNPALSYMEVYYNTDLERQLAVRLGIPILGATADLRYWNGKSGAREIFAKLGIGHPRGRSSIRTLEEAAQAISELRQECPGLEKVVLKLNEGFSGIGSLLIDLNKIASLKSTAQLVAYLEELSASSLEGGEGNHFAEILADQGGVVESFIAGPGWSSPTVQIFITPLGELLIDSTHEQELGGGSNLEYVGCTLPARQNYVQGLHCLAQRIGRELLLLGAVGPAAIDFVAVPKDSAPPASWVEGEPYRCGDCDLYAIEINLRRGGTTHPLSLTSYLTGGGYDPHSGTFRLPSGEEICYVSFSNIAPPEARGLCPSDVIDIANEFGLHYNSALCSGVIFHMFGSLSQYGCLGGTCVAPTPKEAWELVESTRQILAKQARELSWLR